MRALPLFLAFCATATAAFAQANCSAGASPALTIATQTPFGGNSLYGHPNFPSPASSTYPGFSFLFDLNPNVAITISRVDLRLFDDGGVVDLGNGTTVNMPNQVGTTTTVTWYVQPGVTWVGSETTQALWLPYGTGTLTVGASGADSPVVFSTPLSFPPGLWACALVVDMPTTGAAPGPLHPMLDPNTGGVVPSYGNSAMTWTNVQFQRESWTASLAPPVHKQNLEIHYTTQSGYANWTSFGTGCVAPNAPVMGLTARPILGTTITFRTTGIQTSTPFVFWLFGFAPDATGSSLAGFGLPGCNLYLQLGPGLVTNVSSVTFGLATVTLALPNTPSLSGVVLFGQSAPATPGLPAGFVASNAVCVAVGQV